MPEDLEIPLTDWVCHVTPDVDVRLGDFVGTEWDEIAGATGRVWFEMAARPLAGSASSVQAIYELCCRKVEVEPKTLTTNELWAVFSLTPDDRPTRYTAGLPDPKVDDLETTGSPSSP